MNILIIVDNLEIGGIQRLALDQFYFLRSLDTKVNLLVLSSIEKNEDGFLQREEIFRLNELEDTDFLSGKFLRKIKIVSRVLRDNRPNLVISHSVSHWMLFLRLYQRTFKRRFKTTLTHHQFPLFSSRSELRKRFFFSEFVDALFAYSSEVARQWNDLSREQFLMNLGFKRNKMEVVRNGVYLGRLRQKNGIKSDSKLPVRLIFVGRAVAWKGISRIGNIVSVIESHYDCKVIIFSPKFSNQFMRNFTTDIVANFEFIEGKTIDAYSPTGNDIHIFPVDYGNSEYLESVSISCLEMAYLGVPSMVTKGGLNTWPELRDTGLFYEVDWSSPESIRSQLTLLKQRQVKTQEVSDAIAKIVDVRENLRQHFRVINSDYLDEK